MCTIFRASRKQYHYLYVADGTEVDDLPAGLLGLLGDLHKVMDLDLASREELSNADITRVREQLADCGYYLQMPPGLELNGQGELFTGTEKFQ
jgi:uncharacterized protein YcgL (UPF0745 family)